jgi:hypothetical protein
MNVSITVEIPESHRLTIDVPPEVPAGRAKIIYSPITETEAVEFADTSVEEVMTAGSEILDKHISAFKTLTN